MFGKNEQLSNEFLEDKARRMLDSALNFGESSVNHAYFVKFNLNSGFFDIVFNVPTTFAIDEELNKQLLKIFVGGFYPVLMIYSNNGPEFVDTKTGDFATARALRYYFKVGQFSRLHLDNLSQAKMVGSVIPLMNGFEFDLYGSSGMVALSGASGNGKTALLCYLLASVANSIPNAVIKIADPKLDLTLHNFAKKRHITYVSPDENANDFMNDVQGLLAQAVDEIHKRQKKMVEVGKMEEPPFILAIDEAMAIGASITDNKAVKRYQSLITQITLMGRSSRVFLFTSAQTYDATTVMNSSSRDQMAFKVILSSNPSKNDCRYLFKELDPSNIVINRDGFNKGLGLASVQPNNRVVPFMAPYIAHLEE